MIGEFLLQNVGTKEYVTFGQDVGFDYVYNDGDIDWDTVGVKHNTFEFPNQTGLSISSTKVNDRDVTINGYVYYIPTEREKELYKDIDSFVYQKILEKKRKLNRVIDPQQFIKLTIGEYYIIGKPSRTIKWATKYKENNDKFCKFQISLYCNNPMFKREAEQVVLSGSLPAFKFPLIIPQAGMIFGERRNYHAFGILNSGDVPVGAKFRIRSNGVVKGFTMQNATTGEYFRINKTLQDGEEIIVNTDASSARSIYGYIDGEELNYFKYWDFEGKWIQFPVGQSYITYTLEEGNVQLVDVSLVLTPAKFDIEEE